MNRIISIDLLKFIATLLIFNHLAQPYYGKYSMLATGGGMGCALFYFISGYLCQQGRKDRFDLWMKRKLSRLWPICIVTAFVGGFFGHRCSVAFALSGSGWFVTLLLVYYVLYYVVVRMFPRHLGIIASASLALTFLAYALGFGSQDASCGAWLFGENKLKYFYFFPFFMLGAWVSQRKDSPGTVRWGGSCIAGHFVCLILFVVFSGGTSVIGWEVPSCNAVAVDEHYLLFA